METMGEQGFSHGMTPDLLKRIRELEKENKLRSEIVIQKKIERRIAKKEISLG